MVTRRSVKVSVTAVAIALLLAACSGGGNDADERPLEKLTPAERTVQTNPDRNAAEVVEKAAAIDPCALLAAGVPPDAKPEESTPVGESPHACWLSDSSVRVDVLTSLREEERFRLARFQVAGTVGYRVELDDGRCLVHLPVSHNRAISFSGLGTCTTTTAYADAAARVLQDDPRGAARPAGLSRVPACDLVTAAGRGPDPYAGESKYTVLDRCGVDGASIDLQLEYSDTRVRDFESAHQVTGTTVRTQQTADRCYLRVPLAPADIAVDEDDVLNALVTTMKCRQGLTFAKKLIPAARTVELPDRTPTGLLYAWAEPDTSAVGACADITAYDFTPATPECTPAEDAEVPDDRRDLIMQAEADPNVLCAAATPAVRDHYGDAFIPVTALAPTNAWVASGDGDQDGATQCAFGSPEHTLQISIVLSTAEADVETDDVIGNHPALIRANGVMASTADKTYVVARHEATEPGFLSVQLQVWPERGTGIYGTSGTPVKPDTTPLKTSEAFVADLADALL